MNPTSQKSILSFCTLALSTQLIAKTPVEPSVGMPKRANENPVYLEFAKYEQVVHSSNKGFEQGENTEVQAAIKYHSSDDTSFRFRFNTDPKKNSVENKTSKLEVIMNHQISDFEIQMDADLKFDEYSRGASTYGPDTDSDYSFISYKPNESWAISFYPFNFNSEVGDEFYTGDVARIYYIEGTPESIPSEPVAGETIRTKTLPGFDVQYLYNENLTITLGAGAARYLYPNGESFDIETDLASESWQAKADKGYKVGIDYKDMSKSLSLKYVTHDETEETGALLESAVNLQLGYRLGKFTMNFEGAYSKAGKKAYDIAYDSGWFSNVNPWRPVYKDDLDQPHSWLGKEDTAYFARLAYDLPGGVTPYATYKTLGKNFVFWEVDSVHRLRTADDSESHGGLTIAGLGLEIKRGGYTLTPEYEVLSAKNRVFENATDIRENDSFVERNDQQSRFTMSLIYNL